MSTPLVSIAMPAYNSEPWITEAITSIRAQTFREWELHVVDDGSKDNTIAIATAAAGDDLGTRIHIDRLPHSGGPATARNYAITTARGRWLAFLDSDDRWYPSKLERQLAFAEQQNAGLTFHSYRLIDEDGMPLGLRSPAPARVDYASLLTCNIIGCLAAMYDTTVVGRILMPPLAKRQDHGLWLRILRSAPYAFGLDEDLADYRVRRGSVSRNKMIAALWQWRLYRAQEGENLAIIPAMMAMCRYAGRHLIGRRFQPVPANVMSESLPRYDRL